MSIMRFHIRGKKDILKRLQSIVAGHTKRGFQVNEYHSENEFDKIEADIMPFTLNTQATGEHKPTSEQNIRMLKDSTRSTVHLVPYRKMPPVMIDYIVGQAQSMLNAFPSETRILTTMSARNIFEGNQNLD